ncbi:MAG: TM0996/MTH895 family glutaredoxin-like protein [Bacteroidales bacterium]|nr:TM0996/MTH895 family glutaredoxin-like protein [Candidatus Latescibacterota bacterium]
MKKVEVLGTGCAKCKQLFDNARKAGMEAGIDIELEKVEDINKIVGYGVMMTPALVIDGKIVSSGKVLSWDDIADMLRD